MRPITKSSMSTASRVVWTVRARRKLDQVLAVTANPSKSASGAMSKQEIEERLSQSFEGRDVTIVVQDLYVGFRAKPDQCILYVEVDDADDPGPRVVKVGEADVLRAEMDAWNACRPYGLKQDLVLMTLAPRYDSAGKLISLVYGDAKQSIGVDVTCSLEEAVTNAVLHGTPTVLSIRFALMQLYERLGQLLHSFSKDDESCRTKPGPHLALPRLWESLQRWGATLRPADRRFARPDLKARVEALTIRKRPGNADRPEFDFRDPICYLAQYVKPHSTWLVQKRETLAAIGKAGLSNVELPLDRTAMVYQRPRQSAERLIPVLRRGKVHGDLHGRNVHVGIADGQAHWPSVFDFEDMETNGLIGLDFVKLEMELKIRILPRLFPQPAVTDNSLPLQEFEYSLNVWSESALSSDFWPRLEELAAPRPPEIRTVPPAPISPETANQLARLRTIVLEIRRLAAQALGARCGRPADWLREYLFLQMCYGVMTVRFPNLSERELTSAYIAAGSAAGWLDKNERAGASWQERDH